MKNSTPEANNIGRADVQGMDCAEIPEEEVLNPDTAEDAAQPPLWETDSYVLNPDTEIPQAHTWGSISGTKAIEKEGLIAISAKKKQGKSSAVYALINSIISGRQIDTFKPNSDERPRLVMIFDTEMNVPTLLRRSKSLYEGLQSKDRGRIAVVPLLPIQADKRLQVIEDMTARYNPDIVVVDVITKLINDYNDSKDSLELCKRFETFAAERTCFVVIHQNKSKEDSNMKGHLGTLLAEAAVEVFEVTKSNSVFTLQSKDSRSYDPADVPPVSIVLTDDYSFAGASQVLARQTNLEAERWRNDLRPIFGTDKTLTYSEIKNRIAKHQGLSESAAVNKIKLATSCKAIIKTGNGRFDPYKIS